MSLIRLLLSSTIFLTLSIPSLGWSKDNFLEFGDINFGRDFKEKSKWLFKSGAELINYPTVLPEFDGEHENIGDSERNELNGYGLNFGRDFYLTNGFSTLITVGAYYSKTLDKTIGKAAQDIDLDFSETRTAHQLSAYEAAIAFNYIFDYKIVDIQPFIEVGAGVGSAKTEKQYKSIGLTSVTNGSENYDVTVNEDFTFSRVSLGVNLISYKGLMSYLKLTSMQIDKSSRKIEGNSNAYQSATVIDISSDEKNLKESETVTMVSVGIGRYF
jgi:hypothetical protein